MSVRKKLNPTKIIVLVLLVLVFVVGLGYTGYKVYMNYKDIKDNTGILDDLPEIKPPEEPTEEEPQVSERQLQLQELQKTNKEIIGWIEIADTNINYPVAQHKDNDYYLNHNYKNEKSSAGAIYFDKDVKINESDNLQIYGHRNKYGLMFEPLIKYAKKDFYEEHKTINLTTLEEDATYEILAIFYSRVYYSNETNVFRYYYFVNAESEKEYNEFVNNAKNASKFDTGVDAKYGDKLITLSTCEYSRENGRFVIVAKKISD